MITVATATTLSAKYISRLVKSSSTAPSIMDPNPDPTSRPIVNVEFA